MGCQKTVQVAYSPLAIFHVDAAYLFCVVGRLKKSVVEGWKHEKLGDVVHTVLL